jgi:hypothetical protein
LLLLNLFSVTNALFHFLVKGELILSKSVYEAHYAVDIKNKTESQATVTQDMHHISCSLPNIIRSRARHIRWTEDLKLTGKVEKSYKNMIYQQRGNTFYKLEK